MKKIEVKTKNKLINLNRGDILVSVLVFAAVAVTVLTGLVNWGATLLAEIRKIGASEAQAARVAGNACRWWHNSRLELNRLMPIAYFDHIGVPRLS